MARGHTPFGYRIQNGRAVLCDSEVQQIIKASIQATSPVSAT